MFSKKIHDIFIDSAASECIVNRVNRVNCSLSSVVEQVGG